MDKICENNLCTGCTACYSICPKNAITMIENEEGFKYPVIDNAKCIDCQMCKKTCPILKTEKNESLNECYAAFSKDKKIRENGSSGGIFQILAEDILNKNGIVIGAAFDKKFVLSHIPIEKYQDLDKLLGSKYVQSDMKKIYKYIKDNLKDRLILFVGTPCQVAGLKSYIKENNENLITIDFICHGVPSNKVFQKYIKEIEEKNEKKISYYSFRNKENGWKNFNTKIVIGQDEIVEQHNKNNYMKIFLWDLALRQSCYNCKFKLGNKYSDITLGDFWGIENMPQIIENDDGGVSSVIINTIKGKRFFEENKEKIIYNRCKIEDILKINTALKESVQLPKNRKKFFINIDKYTTDELIKKYIKKESKIILAIRKIKGIIKKKLNGGRNGKNQK